MGSVTGWTRTSMTAEEDNVFSYSTTLAPNSNGGFYFLNADDFDNSDGFGREPNGGDLDGCDTWDADNDVREYLVPSNDVVFSYKWGSCSFIEESATVPAVFTVDMTGVDVTQGVYINGGITGWTRTLMTHLENNIYSYKTDIAPNSNGGFYFLNADDFDNSDGFGREPNGGALDGCDTWDGDNDIREYLIMSSQTVYAFDWGSCTSLPQYDLNVSDPANAAISINGENVLSGLYSENTVVSLMVTPDAGYQFDGWGGDASGTANPLAVTMDANKTITATFSQIPTSQFGLTVNATSGGSVNPSTGTYNANEVVNVTATPDAGYQFDGWGGDASGTDNPLAVTMDANKTITANFSLVADDPSFYLGVDLSYVNEIEGCGATYTDKEDRSGEPYSILSSAGANIVRLRLWHNPDWTDYSDLDDVKISIGRAKSANMQVILDFHFSDFWADLGRQWRPAAWEEITNDDILGDSVYNYTQKVLLDLQKSNLIPDFVQVGNETNGNILQPRNGAAIDASSPNNFPVDWSRQVSLLQRGIDAVTDFNQRAGSTVKTIIHVANPIDAIAWFTNAVDNGLSNFDVIGLSYYPQWHDLGVRQVGEHVALLKNQFTKEVMIVETGYPWTNDSSSDNASNVLGLDSRLFTYSGTFSVETQRDFLIELTWLVKESGGLGVVYWEPAWISTSCQTFWSTGSNLENATLFDFDGKLHAGSEFLSYDYSVMPEPLNDQSVTFIVDMTGVSTENGVFVTGDFTDPPRSFQEMNPSSDNLFELEATIPGRSSGAYVYYNDDQANDTHRETVPSTCAKIDEIYREYIVRSEDVVFHSAWNSCDENVVVTAVKPNLTMSDVRVYPNPTVTHLTIKSPINIIAFEITDQSGKKILNRFVESSPKVTVDLLDFPEGVYILSLFMDNNERKSMKIFKY